jgi:hypothetical protein
VKTSETIGKIAAALLKAQRQITFAVKDAKNPQFKSTYADLASVIDACKPALNEAGIVFVQMAEPCDPGMLALSTRLIHESGEWIESTATCATAKADAQSFGSATTYLRRYSLAAAVGLYQDDDDGNSAADAKRKQDAKPPDLDMSPKARAQRITTGVMSGDAAGAAVVLSTETDKVRAAIWGLLDDKTRNTLTAAWPVTA